MKQLFIGAEGTLGVVTKVAILAPRAPEARIVTIYACDTFDNVVGLMVEVKKRLAENLSAVEFFDRESLKLTVDTLPGAKDPFPYDEDNNNWLDLHSNCWLTRAVFPGAARSLSCGQRVLEHG